MNNPQKVLISADTPSLEGVKQYYSLIEYNNTIQNQSIIRMNIYKEKGKKLLNLLTKLTKMLSEQIQLYFYRSHVRYTWQQSHVYIKKNFTHTLCKNYKKITTDRQNH